MPRGGPGRGAASQAPAAGKTVLPFASNVTYVSKSTAAAAVRLRMTAVADPEVHRRLEKYSIFLDLPGFHHTARLEEQLRTEGAVRQA